MKYGEILSISFLCLTFVNCVTVFIGKLIINKSYHLAK